jgi:hypothetical protein
MAKLWDDMTTDEKLDSLRRNGQATRNAIAGISARLDEVGGVVVELEKQLKELQGAIARQGGRPRTTIITSPARF